MKHFVVTLGKGDLAPMEFETIEEAREEGRKRLKTRRYDEVVIVFNGEVKEAKPK